MALEPMKKGEIITADWLNRLAREAGITLQPGWGSGLVSSGRGQVASQVDYLTAIFKASEDFAEAEDIYKGNAKLWWYNPVASAYEAHGDDVEVWSHEDGVEEDDIFPAFFNQQSGRWERIGGGSGGGCDCKEIHRFWTNGPSGGTFYCDYTIDDVTETLEWSWDATAADVRTAFLSHSKIATGDVEVVGGRLPYVAVYITFTGSLEGKSIGFPILDNAYVDDGAFFMDKFSTVELS